MKRQFVLTGSVLFGLLLALVIYFGAATSDASANGGVVPAGAVPVTCTATGIRDATLTILDCVDNGGIDPANSYQAIPAGKYLFVTDISYVSTQVFTTSTRAMLRLSRETSGGLNHIIYEMRTTDANSDHSGFQTPIIRLNAGDQIMAQNIAGNSSTNVLRVYVVGWLTDIDVLEPTAISAVSSSFQLTPTPTWQIIMFVMMGLATLHHFWQTRKEQSG